MHSITGPHITRASFSAVKSPPHCRVPTAGRPPGRAARATRRFRLINLDARAGEGEKTRSHTPCRNPRAPSFPRATAAADAGAEADGEEASRLQQPRKDPLLPPSWSPPFPCRSPMVSAQRLHWGLQDERYAIQGEKYQGQQYSHIYFTRLHHMRNLLHALVPSWKPQLPGPAQFPPLLSSFVSTVININIVYPHRANSVGLLC